MFVRVEVVAGARRETITKIGDHRFAVTVRAPAQQNLANDRVRELLAAEFGVAHGSVRLVSGHHSPRKMFSIEDNTT